MPGRPRLAVRVLPPLLTSMTAAFCGIVAAVGLHGTRWGFGSMTSDAGFRTQAVTRYADTGSLLDYGYRGLPAYYPPGLPWVEGRLAHLLDVPGWTMLRPTEIVLAALIPVLAFACWRRVLPGVAAALVVVGTTLAAAAPAKPDEWLVLAVVVPWWLEVARGVRRSERRPWAPWRHGVLLGVLLLVHTYWFLPLGLATMLGIAVDRVRHRPFTPRPLPALVIAGTASIVSAVYWAPAAWSRLTGPPSDNLQLRWSPREMDIPPAPWHGPLIALGVLGGLWMIVRFRRSRVAESLAVAAVAAFALGAGGELLERYGVALLAFKNGHLLRDVLVAGGVLALVDLADRRWLRRTLLATAAALLLVVPGGVSFAGRWATGPQVQLAHVARYPDGSYPTPQGAAYAPQSTDPFDDQPGDPSVQQVLRRWHQVSGRTPADDSHTVLVTTRTSLVSTTPVWTFTAWKSIYSHPQGQYVARLALLRRVAACADARCAHDLLRHNPYDAVDGLVLERDGDDLVMPIGVDTFPHSWDLTAVRFPARLWTRPWFERSDVGRIAVIAVR